MIPLPVDKYLSKVADTVRDHPITAIEAPPGTGKTTRIAPSLLNLVAPGQRIYLVQPRRIAARAVAERIAQESNVRLGEQIGYAVRFEHKYTDQTQLIVATEGVLIRKLQQDPTLQDTAMVVLDEFHERSLDADLLLGMLRRVQTELRDEMRLVIMSATLNQSWLAQAIPSLVTIQIDANHYPVKIEYRPPGISQDIVEHTSHVVGQVALTQPGDLLVFLPGAGEIQRCCQALGKIQSLAHFDIVPLYGSMRMEEQAKAIQMGSKRRIIVSTNIAETSLTIPGVQTVIDSGLARILRFSSSVGLDRLVLENISAASATQRAGRAGRIGPGLCIRLWSQASDRARSAFLDPEIHRVDLSGARLQLHAWGEGDRDDFPWIESPRKEAWASAARLLNQLGAIDDGSITKLGLRMSQIPLHPRLARLCLEAGRYGCLDRAAVLASLLSERDPFERRPRSNQPNQTIQTKTSHAWPSDCVERLKWIERPGGDRISPFGSINPGTLRSIKQAAQQILRVCQGVIRDAESNSSNPQSDSTEVSLQRSLLAGFPDRLAKRRQQGKSQGLMVGGKGVRLTPESGVRAPELFLCIDVEASDTEAVVRQASAVEADWLVGNARSIQDELFFHPTQKQVVGRRRTYWLDLCLTETPIAIEDEQACTECLLQAVKANWQSAFPSDDPVLSQWLERLACLRAWVPELQLPEVDLPLLHQAASEICRGKRSLDQVRAGAWTDWLQSLLTNTQAHSLQTDAPERIQVPSGSSIRIEYKVGKPPVLAVKIQEVFSWRQTPRIARGRVPLLLHLLGPNGRPQQITDDLASFWNTGYSEVKKELKRRYPRHSWPDDPWTASASRR